MEKINLSLRRISSEAGNLLSLSERQATAAGMKQRLRQLQTKVDQLRREIWQARRFAGAEVVELSGRRAEAHGEHSLVDRVLAIFDRRCG